MRIWIVFAVLFSLLSCEEETSVNLIKGTLYKDCETPLANSEVALKTNIGGSFGEPFILASGRSDQNGNFSFTYELELDDKGNGDLLLIKPDGFKTLIKGLKLNVDYQLQLFENNQSELAINLSGGRVFDPTDTLYYGESRSNQELFKVAPENGSLDTLKVEVPNRLEGKTSLTLYYGIGLSDLKIAREALLIEDSSYNHRTFDIGDCENAVEYELVIN